MYPAIHGAATHLVRAGVEVDVFALKDRKWNCKSHEPEYRMHELNSVGPLKLGYSPQFSRALIAFDLDLIHTHGIWMYPSYAVLRWSRESGRRFMVSPHGMLDTWARRRSALKKRLAGALFEYAHLRGAACIHALCEAEYSAIRTYGLRNPVAVVPIGVDLPSPRTVGPPSWAGLLPKKSSVMLFLGRLHPKKGLGNLARAWAIIRTTYPSLSQNWHLVIAGWDEKNHRSSLEQMVFASGVSESVHFVGPQFGMAKAGTLSQADAFILPSLSEGLPIAPLEAWTYCLPVLMTQECNLPEGFNTGAALQIGNTVQDLTLGLLQFFEMTDEERWNMGQRGRALVESHFSWARASAELIAVYNWVSQGGALPACVRIE
jgi:glycosyltransferase involved in cell wall biosynthesis